MSKIYKNITNTTAVKLSSRKADKKYTKLSLCNIHATDAVLIDLYVYTTEQNSTIKERFGYQGASTDDIRRGDGSYVSDDDLTYDTFTYYILKEVEIPKGSTLFLDESTLFFDNTQYDLYIKLSAADSAVDLILDYVSSGVIESGSTNPYSGSY